MQSISPSHVRLTLEGFLPHRPILTHTPVCIRTRGPSLHLVVNPLLPLPVIPGPPSPINLPFKLGIPTLFRPRLHPTQDQPWRTVFPAHGQSSPPLSSVSSSPAAAVYPFQPTSRPIVSQPLVESLPLGASAPPSCRQLLACPGSFCASSDLAPEV